MMSERDELWVRVADSDEGPAHDGPAKWYTLTAFAAALAPHLRPLLTQPAPADVLSLDAKLQRAELRAADMADTVAAQERTIAKLMQERDELAAKWDNTMADLDLLTDPKLYGGHFARVRRWLESPD
jgi:hypothetical protein